MVINPAAIKAMNEPGLCNNHPAMRCAYARPNNSRPGGGGGGGES